MFHGADHLIFFDTEFTDLDHKRGELISLGFVKITGETLYLELPYEGEPHPWVVEHVLPTLSGTVTPLAQAREQITAFFGGGDVPPDKRPMLVAYVNQFDAVYWYDLFGSPKDHPAYWIPLDFASILFAWGYHPNAMGDTRFLNDLGVSRAKYTHHNALSDAQFLRDVYMAMVAQRTTQ
jgi:hypothetical protein